MDQTEDTIQTRNRVFICSIISVASLMMFQFTSLGIIWEIGDTGKTRWICVVAMVGSLVVFLLTGGYAFSHHVNPVE